MEIKKRKINVFDIVIILVLVVAALVVFKFMGRTKTVSTVPVVYQVELQRCEEGLSQYIIPGTKIYDSEKNYEMGTIKAVEVNPMKKLAENRVDGGYKETVVEGEEQIIITVEAQAVETDSQFQVPSGYVIKTGKDAYVKGSGFAGKGFVIRIER